MSRLRKAGRRTNLGLLGLLVLAALTGGLAFGVGTPGPARLVTLVHAVAGLGLLLLVPWKQVVVRRGLRRAPRPGRVAGIALAVLIPVSLAAGVLHSLGGFRLYLGLTPMQLHVGAALAAVPFAVFHVLSRRQRPRRTDLSRRSAVAALGVVAGAAVTYALGQGIALALSLPGRARRATGSHQVGSHLPALMPVTQWLSDAVPAIDTTTWTLHVISDGGVRRIGYRELSGDGDEVSAVLDCTGGWYADQRWRGVRLDRLLPALPPSAAVEVVSVTGYRRRFPAADLPSMLLATHVEGAPLSAGHGAPARLVAPGRRGFWWVKWVSRIEVVPGPWWWQPPFPVQ